MQRLALMVALFAACGGGRSVGTRDPRDQVRPKGLPEGPLPLPAILALLPGDSASLVGIDAGKARASAYYADYVPLIRDSVAGVSTLVVDPCFDLLAKADIAVGTIGLDPARPDQTLFVFTVSYSRDQLRDCARRAGNVTVADDGDISRYQLGAEQIHLRWLSTHTFGVAGDASAAALGALGTAGGRAADNQALMALVDKTETGAMLWFAVDGSSNPLLSQNLTVADQRPAGAYGWANLPDRLDGKFAVTYASDDEAAAAEKEFRAQIDEASRQPMVGSYTDALSLTRSGREVQLAVAMSARDVSSVMSLIKLAL